MTHRFSREDFDVEPDDLDSMSRGELKDFAWLHFTAHRECRNKLNEDSTNSSCPPSTDNPFGPPAKALESPATTEDTEPKEDAASCDANAARDEAGKTGKPEEPGKRNPGKQPGAKGHGRARMNMKAEEVHHVPTCCAACTAPFGQDMKRRCVSAHHSLELSSGDMSQKITLYKHVYHAVLCHCGHDNVASPAAGMGSHIDGRRRNLEMSERCLIGPALAAYIANLSIKYRLSRSKIGELLYESFGLALSTATIERCIHELGLASEPVVKRLIDEIQQSGDPDQIVNVDETPWYQKGQFLWLWVMTNKFTTVFRIGSRRKEELVELIGESFMGWMITDGYRAYRDHLRRQRCLAHLIRKGLALAEGFYGKGSEFGRRLVAQLRGLIQRVHDGVDADTPAMKRFMSRLKFNCECNRYADEKKVRQLAGEILNDWDAVVAFVHNPELPPTNNDAERALRHAIIARKISFGTRTDEGSRFYAAALSVITTCRQRGVKTLGYIASLIAAARAGLSVPPMPDIPDIPTRAVA